MKKFLVVLMSAILLLGVLAGCNTGTTPNQTSGTETSEGGVSTPLPVGMLVLNAKASVNISYDADGLVLNVEGADDNGKTLTDEYTDYLGKSCSDVICDLISSSATVGFLNDEANYIMIKQTFGSSLPGATFLETIFTDAQAAATEANSSAKLILLTEENLDDNGYIDLDSAEQLLLEHLALESLDTLDGTATPIDGMYNFFVTAGELQGYYIINAVTGDVFEGVLEDSSFEEIPEDSDSEEAPEDGPTDTGYPTEGVIEENAPIDEP